MDLNNLSTVYIGFVILLVLALVIFLGSMYIKTCVKTQVDEITYANKKKKKQMKLQMLKRQRMQAAQQQEMAEHMNQEAHTHEQQDMESYMDPMASNQQDNIAGFNQ
jgi:predicted Holliday junction resolvase-like endonuclease